MKSKTLAVFVHLDSLNRSDKWYRCWAIFRWKNPLFMFALALQIRHIQSGEQGGGRALGVKVSQFSAFTVRNLSTDWSGTIFRGGELAHSSSTLGVEEQELGNLCTLNDVFSCLTGRKSSNKGSFLFRHFFLSWHSNDLMLSIYFVAHLCSKVGDPFKGWVV